MTDDEVRDEVRRWLADNWDASLDRGQWAQLVFDAGWAVPSWEPQWWGAAAFPIRNRASWQRNSLPWAHPVPGTTVRTCSPAHCTTSAPTSRNTG